MTIGRERIHTYKVRVEYFDGTVSEYEVERNLWHRHLYEALEKDDRVEHYIVEMMEV